MNKLKLIPLEERIVLDAAVASVILHVTNGHDSGAGSLRDAINTANHASGQDKIEFTLSPSFNGTINLTSGPLDITKAVTILGQGQVTVNGTPSSDVFDVNASGVTLSGLTILGQTQASTAGAGVQLNGSNNLVTNDTILGNYQGILDNAGKNTITSDFIGTNAAGTTTGGNAFGVYLDGTGHDTISNDVISGNMANTATYNFTNFSDFSAGYPSLMGGGIWIATSGAGYNLIQNDLLGTNAAATATIANDVALYSAAGHNTLTGDTIAGYQVLGVFFDVGANNNLIQNNVFDMAFNAKGQAHSLQAAPEVDFVSQISSLMVASSNNQILGNNFAGISYNDIQLFAGANGNGIENNLFGVTPAGQAAYGWGGDDSDDIWAGYVSNTIVSNNTMLNATGNSVVFIYDTFNGLAFEGQNISITNNTFGGPALFENPNYVYAGPAILNFTDVTFSNNNISQMNSEGLYIAYSQNVTISNNTVSQVDFLGPNTISGPQADNAIGFTNNQNITVTNNRVSQVVSPTGVGMANEYNQYLTIANNTFTSANTGINSSYDQYLTINNNTISDSQTSPGSIGIWNYGNTDFTVANNSVSNVTVWGIFTCHGTDGLIENNLVQNATNPSATLGDDTMADGIRCCMQNSNVTIANNIVLNSDVGVAVAFENTGITISNDQLVNDLVGIYIPDINNQIAVINTSILGGQYGLYVDPNITSYGSGPATGNTITISNSIISNEAQAAVYANSTLNSIALYNDALINNDFAIYDVSTDGHDFVIKNVLFIGNKHNYNY